MSRDTDEVVTPEVETSPIPEAPVEAPQVDATPTDAPVVTEGTPSTDEASTTPAAPVPSAEELAEKAKADAEALQVLLDAFESAAQTAVASADAGSAELPEDQVNLVKAAFSALPVGSARTRAKKYLNDKMRSELGEARVVQAKAFMTLDEAVKATSTPRPTVVTPPVDPTQELVDRAAALFVSANFLTPGPGVADDWAAQTQKLAQSLGGEIATYRDYLVALSAYEADTRPAVAPEGTPEGTTVDVKGDAPKAPEVSHVVVNAARIAQGRTAPARKPRAAKDGTTTPSAPRATGPRSTERLDIKGHIKEVFANLAVGTFMKFGDIQKTPTSLAPQGAPSQGAISASVKSNRWATDVPNLVHAEQDGVQGVRKVA